VAPQGVPPAGKLVTTHDELPALLEVVREAGGDCTARFHLGIGGDEPPCPLATFEERARIPAPAGRLAGSCGGDGEDRAETTLVWSADRTGEVEITARAAGFVPVVYVRTMPDGQCGKARDELACALAVEPGAPVSVFVDVQEGESYVVVIDGAPPGQWIECAGGECDVTLEEAPVCPAQALPSAPVAADASGSNRLAGTCGGDGAVELTWGWDAPGAGAYVARVTSADGGHVPLATHVHLGEVCGGIGDELDCSPAPVRYGTRTWGEVWLADLAADDAVVLAAEVGGGVLRDVPFEARMLGPLPDPCGAVVVPAGELESVDDEYVWTGPLLAPDDAAVPNLSSHCGGGQSPNRVLRFTAAPGTYDVEASGSGWSPIVAVHTGPAGGDGACASEAVACHRAGRDEAALLEGFVVDEEAEVLVVVDAVPDGSALVDEPANVRVRIRIADLAPPGEGEGEGEGEGG